MGWAAFLQIKKAEESDEWLDAELYDIYDYARCSKSLKLADELRSVLPVR